MLLGPIQKPVTISLFGPTHPLNNSKMAKATKFKIFFVTFDLFQVSHFWNLL